MDLKFVSKSTEAATIALIRERAAEGDASAQYVLGLIHADSWHFTEAEEWFRKAAEQGHAGAECELGISYEVQHADYAEAVKWYRKAADQGDPKAQCLMGYSYKYEKDSVEAEKWYRKAADQGVAEAQFCLANLCAYGHHWHSARDVGTRVQFGLPNVNAYGAGVPQGFAEYLRWLRIAADHGHAMAQGLMGLSCQEEDPVEAEKWYRKAAVQRDGERQYEYAYEHMQEARVAHNSAQGALDGLHELGQFVPHDLERAAGLFQRLADQGNASAQYRLAIVYQFGWGVHQDQAEASRWNWKAANQGYADALGHCGVVCSLEGHSQDYVQAHKWLSLAASAPYRTRNQEFYRTKLDEIAAKLTPQQLAEAQQLAREWKPTK